MKKLLMLLGCMGALLSLNVSAEVLKAGDKCRADMLQTTMGFLYKYELLDKAKTDESKIKVELLEKRPIEKLRHKGDAAKLFPNGEETISQTIYRIAAINENGKPVEVYGFAEGDGASCVAITKLVLLTSPVVIPLNKMHIDASALESQHKGLERIRKMMQKDWEEM
jgi:hypothetical protein